MPTEMLSRPIPARRVATRAPLGPRFLAITRAHAVKAKTATTTIRASFRAHPSFVETGSIKIATDAMPNAKIATETAGARAPRATHAARAIAMTTSRRFILVQRKSVAMESIRIATDVTAPAIKMEMGSLPIVTSVVRLTATTPILSCSPAPLRCAHPATIPKLSRETRIVTASSTMHPIARTTISIGMVLRLVWGWIRPCLVFAPIAIATIVMPRFIRRPSTDAETESTKINRAPIRCVPREIWISMDSPPCRRVAPIVMTPAPTCIQARPIDAVTAWLRIAIGT